MPATASDVTQTRVRVRRETLAALTEWQVHALRRGAGKPTYGELIDALVETALNAHVDPLAVLLPGEVA